MEERLRSLTLASSEVNRKQWAIDWQKQGGKVIGLLCTYIPEEIIYAAGMLPWHITGTSSDDVIRALVYRSSSSSLFCNHVLESLLSGELDFLDGVIATDREQDLVRLWDVWANSKKTPFNHIMHVPHEESALGQQQMTKETRQLIKLIETFNGKIITEQLLVNAIAVFNKTRTLLAQLYELRKRSLPPLSGTEAAAIVAAASVMPKDKFNHELEALLPYLKERKLNTKHIQPRLLVSSDTLHNLSYIEFIEQAGCLVAMDDLDTGSRYFSQTVETSSSDPVDALSRRYLSSPAHPRMFSWDTQLQQVIDWVKEYNIDGVLELPEMYSLPRQFRSPFFETKLTEAGIPNVSIPRLYHFTSTGQLSTRVGAFIEMLPVKA